MSASVLRSWCTHKEQLVVSPNRRAELCSGAPSREQTSKARTYEQIRAHKSKHVSEWPGDQVRREETREGFGLFFAWVGKAWARYYDQVGEFLDTFFFGSFGPFFWRPAFMVPSFGCHILGLWWAVSVWVDEGWGSEAIRRQTNSPGSVFTLLCSPAYTISLQIWWAFNLRLIISENSNLVTWKATSDCHLCFEELAKYLIWEASVVHEEFFSRIKIYLTPCKFLCRVSSSVINTAESEFFRSKIRVRGVVKKTWLCYGQADPLTVSFSWFFLVCPKNTVSAPLVGQNVHICLQSGPPPLALYGPPDRKISVFFLTTPLI